MLDTAFFRRIIHGKSSRRKHFQQQDESEPVKVELVAEDTSIQEGKPFWVAIHFLPEEGWHLYWKNPGDAGAAPDVEWKLPEGFSVKPLLWPVLPTLRSVDYPA